MNPKSLSLITVCLVCAAWTSTQAQSQQKVEGAPASAQSTTPVSPKDMSLTVVFEDGQTLELTNPILEHRMLSRDIYGRAYSSEAYPHLGIRLRKVTYNRGVTTVDKKDVYLSDMRTIEFLKNKKDECIAFITLTDGRLIMTSNQLDRINKEFWPEGINPSADFEGYYHGDPQNTVQYEIRGYTPGGGAFNAGVGDALNCPGVRDESTNKWVKITRLIVGRKR